LLMIFITVIEINYFFITVKSFTSFFDYLKVNTVVFIRRASIKTS